MSEPKFGRLETEIYQGIRREWLYWYDERGERLLTPEERVQYAEQRTREAEAWARQLAERLRALGVDPDALS